MRCSVRGCLRGITVPFAFDQRETEAMLIFKTAAVRRMLPKYSESVTTAFLNDSWYIATASQCLHFLLAGLYHLILHNQAVPFQQTDAQGFACQAKTQESDGEGGSGVNASVVEEDARCLNQMLFSWRSSAWKRLTRSAIAATIQCRRTLPKTTLYSGSRQT